MAKKKPKKKAKVGAGEDTGSGWLWKLAIGGVIGAIGYKLVESYWPGKSKVMELPPLRIPPKMIESGDYDCFLTSDGGKVVCVPKGNPWPWQVGG